MTTTKIQIADYTDLEVGDYFVNPSFPNNRTTVVRVDREVKPSTMFPGEAEYIEIEVEDFARRWTRRPFLGNGPLTVYRPN